MYVNAGLRDWSGGIVKMKYDILLIMFIFNGNCLVQCSIKSRVYVGNVTVSVLSE